MVRVVLKAKQTTNPLQLEFSANRRTDTARFSLSVAVANLVFTLTTHLPVQAPKTLMLHSRYGCCWLLETTARWFDVMRWSTWSVDSACAKF